MHNPHILKQKSGYVCLQYNRSHTHLCLGRYFLKLVGPLDSITKLEWAFLLVLAFLCLKEALGLIRFRDGKSYSPFPCLFLLKKKEISMFVSHSFFRFKAGGNLPSFKRRPTSGPWLVYGFNFPTAIFFCF